MKETQQGPNGEPPVYKLISNLYAAVKTLVADNQDLISKVEEHGKVLERLAHLSLNNTVPPPVPDNPGWPSPLRLMG